MFEFFRKEAKSEIPRAEVTGKVEEKVEKTEEQLVFELAELEKRRDDLKEWMKTDSTPDDVRLLDQLNAQIEELKNQLNTLNARK